MEEKLIGTWKVDPASVKNQEAYQKASQYPQAWIDMVKEHGQPVITFSKQEGKLHVAMNHPKFPKPYETDWEWGKNFETVAPDGRTIKCLIQQEGDRLKESYTSPSGESKVERWFEGDKMFTTATHSDVTMSSTYIRQ